MNRLDWFMQTLYMAWRLFVKHELTNHAAATAFYFLLSTAPLVLLLTYAAQYLASLAEASDFAVLLLAALYERFRLEDLTRLGLIPQRAQLAAGGVGLLTLLLSSRGLIKSLQSAFRVIFPVETRRKFVVNWTLPLIIIPLVFGLVLLAVVVQASLNFFLQTDLLGVGKALLFKGLNAAFILLSIWGLIYLAFRRLPLELPPRRPALLISALATLTLVGLFLGFGHFFRVEKYQAMYGALGGVVFILIGAYFACLTFYFWAQFLHALTKVDVAALEKLFLQGEEGGGNRLEGLVFARANRLLAKYGRVFAPGDRLITEGEAGQEAILIHSGRVGVYKHLEQGERKLVELEAGSLIGEMAYLLNEPRTASVRAETEVTALVLPPQLLEELMRFSAPLSRRIIGTLAQRLMHMNMAQR
ncbi:MAG TPA: YhjD/YihY/BrkB family envelope integrity protein [Thiobacillaceae bacterium]|nr:YhjD/YihY/BrkB family envelope integrity protein [Thiobacillaceae bacterium]